MLSELPVPHDPRVLIDFRTHDDAGVFRLTDGTALVQTVDFFTPIVDDPYAYGQIAAANALSDVYAMGGEPLTALAIAALPQGQIEIEVVRAIFTGGHDKLREAGVALLGGHTVRDAEVKFGYAVTGTVDPDHVWANAGALPGGRVVLTKPVGTGIVSTAIKRGRAASDVVDAAVASMRALNRSAAASLASTGPGVVQACTDVTGFGLVGHATEIARASGVTLMLDLSRVPWLPGAFELAGANNTAGGRSNRAHFAASTEIPAALSDQEAALVYDPQTSGGLLVVISPNRLTDALDALRRASVDVWEVGEVVPRSRTEVCLTGRIEHRAVLAGPGLGVV